MTCNLKMSLTYMTLSCRVAIISIVLLLVVLSSKPAYSQDQKSALETLITRVQEECRTLAIKYPIETRELQTRESRAYVEQALENALGRYLYEGDARVLITGKTISVQLIIPGDPHFSAKEDQWITPEVWQDMLRRYKQRSDRAAQLRSLLPEAISRTFQDKFELGIGVTERTDEDPRVLASTGDASSKDLQGDYVRSMKIDYEATWLVIKKTLTQNGLSVFKDNSAGGKFELETKPIASSDPDWLYQSYHKVSLFDPYSGDSKNVGLYLRINVVFQVKRRKELGAFYPPSTRSTPEEDKILESIFKNLRVKQ